MCSLVVSRVVLPKETVMNMRVVSSSALLVGCSAVLGCLAGCAQTDVGPVEETGAKSLPVGSNVRRSTVSEVAPGRPVVLGWERKRTLDGQVLDEMMIDEAPDTDVARLAADQTPDQGGTYYAELVGSFTEGDVVTEYSHVIRQEGTVLNGPTKASFAATPAASRSKKSKVSPELETLLTTRAASDTVRVWVEFEAIPKTRLDEARRSARASLAEADGAQKLMDQAVSARKAEVASLQDPVVREIERLGGKAIDSFWLTNEVIADIPASRVRSLSSHAAVRSLSPVTDTPEPPAAYDGEDIAGSTGVNAGSFLSAGWD